MEQNIKIVRRTLETPTSMNNRLLLEEYVNQGQLKREVQHGIAMISQKVNLHGLRVLVEAKLSDGTVVPRNSIAYLKESTLHTAPWAKSVFQAPSIDSKFIIVDMSFVEFISPPYPVSDPV